LTCSDACRRAFDKRQRKIATRERAIAFWRAAAGHYPRRLIRLRVKELRAELYVLAHARRATTS